MNYGSLKTEQLVPLRNALVDLMYFIKKWQNHGIPDFYRYLFFMKNNIETCIYTKEDWGEGLKYLNKILVRDWNLANDEYVGIPTCELFEESQRELCLQYLCLLDRVESYFYSEHECGIR